MAYGKKIALYEKHITHADCSTTFIQLEIYELKTCYKGILYESPFACCRVANMPRKRVSVAKFYEKDGDMEEHRVQEYFGGNFHLYRRF